MGRFFVGILVVVAIIPAIGLARLWLSASRSRQVDLGAMSLYDPTTQAAATSRAAVRRRSRSSAFGILLGILAAVALAVVVGGSTVFFWVPVVILGGLLGVLMGTAFPRRVTWETTAGRRAVPLGGLPLALRVTVLIALVIAVLGLYSGPPQRILAPSCTSSSSSPWPPPGLCLGLGVLVLVAWLTAEAALLRVARTQRIPVDGADVAVDDGLRTAISHTAVGAATVVSLGSLSVIGVGLGVSAASGSCANGGSIGTVLLTTGLAAAIAAVLVAAFLIQWGSQLRRVADTVQRAGSDSGGILGR